MPNCIGSWKSVSINAPASISIKMFASLMSNRIRWLQLAFFVEAHHRDAQQFCRLAFGNVLLGQGAVHQLIKQSWMLLRQWLARLSLAPALGRKPLEHREVSGLSDDATLFGALQP